MLQVTGLRRLALGPVDLALARGECVAITGASGAGKSLLLRAIADLDPHEGDATLDGTPCSAMPAPLWRQRVTYVAAESGWWDETVRGHFPAGADVASLLPRLGLAGDALDWSVARLSTGERQRLALLRAIAREPRVLLLDEPSASLDRDSIERLEALLRDRLARGASILFVTHDPAQARRLGHRRFHLGDGQLTEATP